MKKSIIAIIALAVVGGAFFVSQRYDTHAKNG